MLMRFNPLLIFRCALLVLFMNITSSAAPTTQASQDFKRLESLTITVGDILTRVSPEKMWTLSGIDYQKTVMSVEDSAYGTVVTYPGARHLGTAHFLDVPGKPGEIEKENVTDLRFSVDGQPVAITPKMNLSGKSFRMERKSKIRAIDLESTVIIRDGVLIETAHLRTAEPVELQMSYPLMYAWTPAATAFVFGDDNGIQKRGTFRPAPEKAGEGLEKSARWMSVFEPVSGKGAVCYVIRHPATDDAWLQYTDAPGIYRKLRLMSFVGKTIPADFDGTFQTVVGFFNATQSDWESRALARAMELKLLAANIDKQ
jgi:hypothetical protein